MTEWIVRRWKRYGHDRLYAATPGGTDLGYLDLRTGRYHSDELANLPLLRKAIEDHQRPRADALTVEARREQARQEQVPQTSPAAHGQTRPGWHDLAHVPAGSAARQRALAEREAQGVVRHVVARLFDAKTDERAWRIGADGEEAVAAQFAALGPQWRVLHAVPVGERGADIDHVVIGPGGVFTVNAKHHPRAAVWVGGDVVMVNRRRAPYVRASRFEARRAARLLTEHAGFPVPVTGVIAIVGARRGFLVRNQPSDHSVAVVSRGAIVPFLHAQPDRLGVREVEAIHDVARRSTTWQR